MELKLLALVVRRATLIPLVFLSLVDSAVAQQCALAVSAQGPPKASDSLAILKTAVGSRACDLCVCDVDRSGKTTASDSLAVLRVAVGQPLTLRCVACAVSETIGPQGGTIEAADGSFSIDFPPGSLSQATEITVAGIASSLAAEDFDGLGIDDVYSIEPAGLELQSPATISFALTASEEDGESSLPLATILQSSAQGASAAAQGSPDSFAAAPSPQSQHPLPRESLSEWSFDSIAPRIGLRYATIPTLSSVAQLAAGRAKLSLPSSPPIGVASLVVFQVFAPPITVGSTRYLDLDALHFHPIAGTPLDSSPQAFVDDHSYIPIPYICDQAGVQSYSARALVHMAREYEYREEIFMDGNVECRALEPPQVLKTGMPFTDQCIGVTVPLGSLPAGPKIVCGGGGVTHQNVRIFAPEPDAQEPSQARLLLDTEQDSTKPASKVLVLPGPGSSVNDAILAASFAYRVLRFAQPPGNFVVVQTDPGFHAWNDISLPIIPGDKPAALMVDRISRQYFSFQYEGEEDPPPPSVIINTSAFSSLNQNGDPWSGWLLTPSGPLIGVTSGSGANPGLIFTHDLVDPGAAPTIVGDAGRGVGGMYCDEGLCVVTNGSVDSMTLVTSFAPGVPAVILGDVPIGALPNGAKVIPLGGTRHLVLSTGQGDDSLWKTIIDTEAPDPVESNVGVAAPEGCETPSFIDVLDAATATALVTCVGSSTIAIIEGFATE